VGCPEEARRESDGGAVKIIECEQRSSEWLNARLGKLTASSLGDAFATTKSGFSTSRRNLRLKLVLERLTGKSQESGYTNAAMERGILLEPEARAAYEAESGLLVDTVGFIIHDELLTGASPDGLIGEDGGIEIKCPGAAAHLDYLKGQVPQDYILQIAHSLWLTGRAWWEFASFNPDFPEPLRLKVQRLYAKDIDLRAHELNVRLFLDECDKELREVESLMVGV
jgi:putative phage-type endonuclease